jgi:hypothetical protein
MKKITKLSVLVVFSILLTGAFFIVSASSHRSAPPGRGQHFNTVVPAFSQNETIGHTYLTSGAPNVVFINAGFTVEDSGVSFNCAATSCTLVADMWATTGGDVSQPDNRALCLTLDGNIVGNCAFLGEGAADGTYSAEQSLNSSAVAHGAHTAQIQIYSSTGENLAFYNNVYRVFHP